MSTTNGPLPPDDGEYIYRPYVRHWRTGKLIYPKTAKYFRFRRRRR
jgi:hypothetical protein